MSTIDRLILFIFSAIVAVISLIIAFLPLPFFPSSFSKAISNLIFESNKISLLSIVIFILSLRFLLKSYKIESDTYNYIERESEFGQVRISYNTLRALALSGTKKVKGIKDVCVDIDAIEGEVMIKVTVSFYGDVIIPLASNELQSFIKETVELASGLIVREITILVDETNNTGKRRVD